MIRKFIPSDRVGVKSKLAQKYDKAAESEVIQWIKQLTEIELEPGIYKLGRQLKNGQTLVKLAQKIQEGTAECPQAAKDFVLKLNTERAPFKQMENIQVFLGFCERYGVPISGLFHTKDLFDGNNMQQVLACVIQLGTESQRNHFNGPTIGPKPQEKNIREFSEEKLKASQSIIGMQAGKSAPSLDFQMGAARRIVDNRPEGNKGGKTPETVNGVPDLLDVGKKDRKKKETKKEEDSDEKSDEETKEKEKEEKKTKKKTVKEEEDSEDDEKKEKSPAPAVKSKPKKKDEDKDTEKKNRDEEKDTEKKSRDKDKSREKSERKLKKEKKKKSLDAEEEEEE